MSAKDLIAEARRLDARATKGPWRWWTSNSFRRLSSDATGKDGDVLYACVQPSDGHPDVQCSEDDRVLIERARWLLPAFADELEAALAREASVQRTNETLVRDLAEARSLISSLRKHRDALDKACEDEHDALVDARELADFRKSI